MVGVEVARGAAELGRDGDVVEHDELLLEAFDEDRELLAQRRGRSGLSVGAGQHRHRAPLAGERRQLVTHLLDGRVVDAGHGLLERERNGRIVDILRREAEVDELLVAFESQGIHLLLDDVLDGLDVVVRNRLDLLDPLGVGVRKIGVESAQFGKLCVVDVAELGERKLAQGDEIFHFDADSITNQGLFGKIIRQFFRFVPVAPVDGRDGSQWR